MEMRQKFTKLKNWFARFIQFIRETQLEADGIETYNDKHGYAEGGLFAFATIYAFQKREYVISMMFFFNCFLGFGLFAGWIWTKKFIEWIIKQ